MPCNTSVSTDQDYKNHTRGSEGRSSQSLYEMAPSAAIQVSSRAKKGLLLLVLATCKLDCVPENVLSQYSVISWGHYFHTVQITQLYLSHSSFTVFTACNWRTQKDHDRQCQLQHLPHEHC